MANNLKCYFIRDVEKEEGCAVVAENKKEAIKYGREHLDCDFINIRVNIDKDAYIQDLEKGIIDFEEALKRKIFAYVSDYDCPSCGKKYTTVFLSGLNENKIVCYNCEVTGNGK